jgi:PKD repeat protein
MKNKTFCGILAISIGLLIVTIAIVDSASAINNTAHIVINAFDQNPEGKIDRRNEWVTLYNPTNNSVDISGWTLSSTHYRGGRNVTIENTTIAPKNYWIYIHDKGWLHDKGEKIILKNVEGETVDETLIASDDDNDNRYWARYSDGFDTDSDSDWSFGLQTLEEGVMRKGTVTHVRDGDTIYISPVEMAGVQSVRLVGIEAPELETPEGDKSKVFLEDLCLGKEVEFDVDDCSQYGKYNRILAMVYVNGTNLNIEMLRNGSAKPFILPPSEFVPYANFTHSPLNPIVNQSITFNASSSWTFDPDAAIISYEWVFGDGIGGTGKIVNHTYPSQGNYVVSLKVTDSDGKERRYNLISKTITVTENQPPTASFTYSPLKPVVNQTVTFDASNSTDPGGTIENYEWNFGNGEKAEGKIATHSYSSAGNYTVKLTITDDKGATNSTAQVIHVGVAVATTTVSIKTPSEASEGENFTATVNVDGVSDLAILMFG